MISTRRKIVVIADQLIRSKGYSAFSYADIAQRLNLKNAAIHYHFPSKSDLGLAVIRESQEKFAESRETWTHLKALDRLTAFIEMYHKNSKNNCICFVGALGTDITILPENMKEALQKAHLDIKTWLMNTLEEGKQKKEFDYHDTTDALSDLITSSLMASLILSRISKEAVMENVKDTLLNRIKKVHHE